MTKIEPRWYQKNALESFQKFITTFPIGRNPLIVMPTGTGKSVVIASIIKYVRQWPENKVLVLTHVGELVRQNAMKLKEVWPEVGLGICSAGLGMKDTKNGVIFGTVQTVHSILKRDKHAFGQRCLVIIDECHLLSEKSSSQYRTVLKTLSDECPVMRVCGLSATPYRAKGTLLTEQENPIFTDVAYDLTESFTQLIDEGYLAPLVTLQTPVSVNLEGVHIRGGDFKDNELQAAVSNEELLEQACDIMVKEGTQRKSWLVFVSGIQNSENVALKLQSRGVSAVSVNSSHSQTENDEAIAKFRKGELRCLVSANQLTTGFDVPQVDLIGMLRPTMSVSLHVQSLGRGTRPAEGKSDCLVLDFARNIERLGPINSPQLTGPADKRKGAAESDKPRLKKCPNCGEHIPINSRICPLCGFQPPQDLDLVDLANIEVIAYSGHKPQVKGASVSKVLNMVVSAHRSKKGSNCMRVALHCAHGSQTFKAWLYLCFSGELSRPKEVELLRANQKRRYDELIRAYY